MRKAATSMLRPKSLRLCYAGGETPSALPHRAQAAPCAPLCTWLGNWAYRLQEDHQVLWKEFVAERDRQASAETAVQISAMQACLRRIKQKKLQSLSYLEMMIILALPDIPHTPAIAASSTAPRLKYQSRNVSHSHRPSAPPKP